MEENKFVNAMNQVQGQQAAPASAPTSNPLPFNRENPFGAPSENKGGAFVPTPPMEVLVGRTLVYIPRTFNPTAKDPFDTTGQKTRKQWTADLYVIDGGELRFWYEKKGRDGAPDETVEQVYENASPETPYACDDIWVSQSAFVGKLSAVAEKRQLLVCTVTRGARKDQRDKGKTDEMIRADFDAWVARGKTGPEVKFVWLPVDVSGEAMARVQEWYSIHRDSIKL